MLGNVIEMIDNGYLQHHKGRIFVNNQYWLRVTLWDSEINEKIFEYNYLFKSVYSGWDFL